MKKSGSVRTFTICNFSFTPDSPKTVLPTDKQKEKNGNIVGSLIIPRRSQEDAESQEDTALRGEKETALSSVNSQIRSA